MFKKLLLCAIIASPIYADQPQTPETPVRTVSWTPVKKQTALEIIGNSVKYTIENPVKVAVGSFLILNLCIHGKQSIVCKGINWASKDLPQIIGHDTGLVINSLSDIVKNSYRFLVS